MAFRISSFENLVAQLGKIGTAGSSFSCYRVAGPAICRDEHVFTVFEVFYHLARHSRHFQYPLLAISYPGPSGRMASAMSLPDSVSNEAPEKLVVVVKLILRYISQSTLSGIVDKTDVAVSSLVAQCFLKPAEITLSELGGSSLSPGHSVPIP